MISRDDFVKQVLALKGKDGKMFWDYFGLECDWCAEFVSYCMKGIAKISDFPKSSSCTFIKKSYANRVNHDYKTAEVGDLILFELRNPEDGPDHIGIVIENNKSIGRLMLIEGNTGNSNFRKSTVNTFGYAYANSKFDCIIDMSSDFADDDELAVLRSKIARIKEIINE